MPSQAIYDGKTDRCLPSYKVRNSCEGWLFTYSPNHWSNEELVCEDAEEVVIPFAEETRALTGKDWPMLYLLDMFKGNLGKKVKRLLGSAGIRRKIIPAGFTDKLQPQDKTDNRSVKCTLRDEFNGYVAHAVSEQVKRGVNPKDVEIDIRMSTLKDLHLKWLKKAIDAVSQEQLKKQWATCGYFKAFDVIELVCEALDIHPPLVNWPRTADFFGAESLSGRDLSRRQFTGHSFLDRDFHGQNLTGPRFREAIKIPT